MEAAKGSQCLSQIYDTPVSFPLDGVFFDAADDPFGHPIGPGMIGLGPPMFDAGHFTDDLEQSGGLVTPTKGSPVYHGELPTVVSEDLPDAEREELDRPYEEISSGFFRLVRIDPQVEQAGRSVDRDETTPLLAVELGKVEDVHMHIPGQVLLERFAQMSGLLELPFVAHQTAEAVGAVDVRQVRFQGIDEVVKTEAEPVTELEDQALLSLRQCIRL